MMIQDSGWTNTGLYILGAIFVPLFLAVGLNAATNLLAERRSRNRQNLIIVQALVIVLAATRIAHFLLGPYHSPTFLAQFVRFPELLLEIIYSIPSSGLMGIFCIELAVFVELGWAAKLKIKMIVQRSKRTRRMAYYAFWACFLLELAADCFLVAIPDSARIHTAILSAFRILLSLFIIIVLLSTLLQVASVVLQRQSLPVASWGRHQPSPTDHADSISQLRDQITAQTNPSLLKRVLIGLNRLPDRAQSVCWAVLVGCLLQMFTSVLQVIALDVELGDATYQAIEVITRALEAAIVVGISHSVRVVTNSDSDSESPQAPSPKPVGEAPDRTPTPEIDVEMN